MTTTPAGVAQFRVARDAALAAIEEAVGSRIVALRVASENFIMSAAIEAGGNSPAVSVASAAGAMTAEIDGLIARLQSSDVYGVFDNGGAIAIASA